jgi:hypothetical protein
MVPVLELNVEDLAVEISRPVTAVTSSRKKAGLSRLPGATTRYLKTMTELLEHILTADPTFDEMAVWIMKQYEGVNSKRTAGGYVRALGTVGAITFDGEKIRLSPEAAEYMKDLDPKKAQRMFLDSVAGAEEAYDYLKGDPKTREQVHDHIQKALNFAWETDAQTRRRLYWLESLGLIARTPDGYQAK